MRKVIAVIVIFSVFLGVAFAQTGDGENKEPKKKVFYQWTDDQGGLHISDSLAAIPERYQPRAREIKPREGKEIIVPERPGVAPDSTDTAETGTSDYWRQRLQEWKKKISDAEQQYRDLDRERADLFRPWGSAAMAPAENRIKAEQIEQKMRDLKSEAETARRMVETEIPEEARKAGVPPGWLRD